MDNKAQQEDDNLMTMMFYDSNEEIPKHQPIIGWIPNKNWNVYSGHQRLMANYLDDDSVYSNSNFKYQFWVTKQIFFCLCNELQTKNQDVTSSSKG